MSRDRPLFADGFPLMMLSQASLASLNTRLGAGGSELVVEETRFRPNILISGDFEGFQEDRSVSIQHRGQRERVRMIYDL